jgi:two-component system, sensor histidine kinase and response regulator
LVCQWFGGLTVALCISPRTWFGQYSDTHIHLWTALFLGGLITFWPVVLVLRKPGSTITRHSIGVAQMLYSAVLIHLTGGRIETHFHVFGSLAFLSFYRDWRVLISASSVVAVDHIFRGMLFPQSLYGVAGVEPWRWLEHAWWVVFEDAFLIYACRSHIAEMRRMAAKRAQIIFINKGIERTIDERTAELRNLANVVQYSNDAIVTFAPNLTITSWNRGAERLLGYSSEEAVGQSVLLVVPEQCRVEIDDFTQEIELGKRVENHETLSVKKDGTFVNVSVSWSVLQDHSGHRTGWSITMRDITERKEAERRVAEFYSIVSHELRTPLTSIRGALGLIESKTVDIGSEEALELVLIARSSTDRLIRLINDMLDLKKIEAGKMDLHPTIIDVSELVWMTVQSLTGMAADARVVLRNGSVPAFIFSDWDKTIQILTNLVSNAIKFSPEGSLVSVITEVTDYQQVRFSVIDNGPGIAPHDQHKLFDKFHQLDSSDARRKEGTGLGLAICKALVNEQHGRIGVNSDLGKGSTFWFEVPVHHTVAPAICQSPEIECNVRSILR